MQEHWGQHHLEAGYPLSTGTPVVQPFRAEQSGRPLWESESHIGFG